MFFAEGNTRLWVIKYFPPQCDSFGQTSQKMRNLPLLSLRADAIVVVDYYSFPHKDPLFPLTNSTLTAYSEERPILCFPELMDTWTTRPPSIPATGARSPRPLAKLEQCVREIQSTRLMITRLFRRAELECERTTSSSSSPCRCHDENTAVLAIAGSRAEICFAHEFAPSTSAPQRLLQNLVSDPNGGCCRPHFRFQTTEYPAKRKK
mmetsp:Transcript_104167/g.155982  ORF Transcript_104167/g.155982 Transcript_104167/m.155982 type:complete len:207 (-) Transcript_104167:301-921(-)